ncbi:prolyl oligopeptidase family serine peptidase [Legionella fallonii]|uniref:Dienelactone hydrolase and related enzyme n=1 Tax=Legionella fallonii LLAP-10 TaxID=1212491 RepID=A0A098G117_9GAMM|nr:prolyl oligopeptidase family serine peptidase [Legionella fallonii]CEG56178.1 Dienelactone hydrolase and related enzyme [Legionella fallonii LLAP-10]
MIRIVAGFICFLLLSFQCMAETQISWQQTTIPMAAAGSKGLEAVLVWPHDGLKHPLALISHGSPRDGAERAQMTSLSFLPIAKEFARRGFSVAVVLRRGYGSSGGGWVEGYKKCQFSNYKQSAVASSEDLHAAIKYLGSLPQFDTNEMIAVGVSAGGFATVALTAIDPPPGLKAAISFAGGRGSMAPDKVCHADNLVAVFDDLGKTSRVPMLWVYAKNDHFFNPSLAAHFYSAFTKEGGKVEFISAAPYGAEGHFLFSAEGIKQWVPLVDAFLREQHLVLVKQLLPLPSPLKTPDYLSTTAKKAFATYAISGPHKAFALSSDGAFGWRTGQHTAEKAKQDALAYCKRYSPKHCKLIAVDDEMVK